MIKKDEMYFNGTTRGDTLRPFVFHFIMMFVLPILAFFFSRDIFTNKGYTEKECTMYPAFIALFCVIIVMTSYVFHILSDKDNWTRDNQTSNIKIAPKKEDVSVEQKKQTNKKPEEKLTKKDETKEKSNVAGQEKKGGKKNKQKGNKNKEQTKKSDDNIEKDEIKKRDVAQKLDSQSSQQKLEAKPKNNNSEPSKPEKEIQINNGNAADKTNKKKKK